MTDNKSDYEKMMEKAENPEILPGMKAHAWMEERPGSASAPIVKVEKSELE